jgi:hypothetical protein
MVGLMVVGLLAVSAPAMAQVPGSLDPLSVITSGAVLPFLGEGLANSGGLSILELAAPVGGTTVHMFLFDANCVRGGPSVNVELSENDIALVRIDDIGGGAPTSGLVTAAASDDGFTLIPWSGTEGLHARTLWASSNGNFVRVLDPIAVDSFDDVNGTGTWNPLRTAATFFAPLESGGIHTTIYFVCPNTNIQRSNPNGGALSAARFPAIFPRFQNAGSTTPLRVRVYDDNENLLRDVTSSCNCLTVRRVTDLDLVYANAALAPLGTYTEVEGSTSSATPAVCSTTAVESLNTPNTANTGNSCPGSPAGCVFGGAPACTGQFQQTSPAVPAGGPFSFTAYRSIVAAPYDVFNRVSNGSICQIQNSFPANVTGGSSVFPGDGCVVGSGATAVDTGGR